MSPFARPVAGRLSTLALALALAGCAGGGASPDPSPSPTLPPAPPAPSPAPTASPDFGFEVVPPEEPVEVRMAIPGQRVCFLVVVTDPTPGAGPVTVAAEATGAAIAEIVQPTADQPVGEVWVVPGQVTEESRGRVTFTATRGGASVTVERTLGVFPMTDDRGPEAQPYFERWVSWLATAHPELGIDEGTAWEPEFVSTLLVVSHYAYFSDEWELTLAWHVMIPPSDWSEIHLRRRGTETAPSLAFRQDSVHDATEPHPVAPPEVVVR